MIGGGGLGLIRGGGEKPGGGEETPAGGGLLTCIDFVLLHFTQRE